MKQLSPSRLSILILLPLLLVACSEEAVQTVQVSGTPAPATTDTPQSTQSHPTQTADAIQELLLDLEATPVRFVLPTALPQSGPGWRPPPYDVPLALRPEDHFYFLRPIPSGQVNWPHPEYRYGNTFFSEVAVHTGVDLGADRGAPVLAAGDGEVIWTGYGLYRGYEDKTDPYGLAVAIRHDFGYQGEQLYTIYAHLESIDVYLGQRVYAGDQLGIVGETGHTTGPHLHFEIRLGSNDYYSTRNPELWMAPPEGWAVLAGRIMGSYGVLLSEHLVQIRNLETNKTWNVRTYKPGVVNPDDEYAENFVISDLPAGPYEIRVDYYGVKKTTQLYLYPGRTNFITFLGWSGFSQETDKVVREISAEPPVP
jgi:murein DD-endopeptidase MepM/ murein hydrolase activator NlpD